MTHTTSTQPKRALWKRILIWAGIVILAVFVFILIVGMFPISLDGFGAQPNPINDYDEAVSRVEALQQEEAPITKEIGRSLLMTHGEKTEDVYVLVHGVTNAPHEFEEFGQLLYDQGANVLILRMPQHGLLSGDIKELKNLTPEQVREYADLTIDIATGLGDNITVIGLSAGGTLAGWLAQNRDEVDRAVLMSPFMGIKQTPMFLDPILMRAFLRLPGIAIGGASEADREWVYKGESSRGVATFMLLGQALIKQAQEASPQTDQILVLTTAADMAADNGWADKLVEIWQQQGMEVDAYEFPKADDIPHASIDPFTEEAIRQKVYDKIFEWLSANPIQ